MEKRREELQGYISHFAAAFDELHQAVVQQTKTPGQYIGPHHDYPIMSILDSGFPSFHEVGFYKDTAPRDYVSTTRPRGLIGLLGGYQRPEVGFPRGAELAEFLRTHDIGKRLNLSKQVYNGKMLDWPVDNLVGDAVERYLHLHGLATPINPKSRQDVLMPLVFGTIWRSLNLRLVVPITMAHFEVDHFPLSETAYITRIPKKLQLARARMSTLGTGAVQMVVGAATHAFVSNGWHLDVDDIHEVPRSLNRSSPNVLDAIDSFFGALRVATGISAGYAQMLWVPRKWALNYFCDLTPVYGATLRQYPSHYDDYGWTRQGATVTAEQLKEVQRIYRAVVASNSEAVRLALRRLNVCLIRTDAADAILDGTIGLELLLGDDQNQSLSYKLRLRSGALARLHADSTRSAVDIAAKVKRLYKVRSSIVHGLRKKGSKRASESTDMSHSEDRAVASDLLRFVLETLLTHPEYQDPTKIDEDLLLCGIDVAHHPNLTKRHRRPRKAKK
jgi:hypothetical protein